jgi:hypothetical protein
MLWLASSLRTAVCLESDDDKKTSAADSDLAHSEHDSVQNGAQRESRVAKTLKRAYDDKLFSSADGLWPTPTEVLDHLHVLGKRPSKNRKNPAATRRITSVDVGPARVYSCGNY